jgi:hypothetical protein
MLQFVVLVRIFPAKSVLNPGIFVPAFLKMLLASK